MHSLCSKFLISSTHLKNPICTKTLVTNFRHSGLKIGSKKSNYQDFQEYAKPSRLLPAEEVKVQADAPLEKVVNSFVTGRYEAFYKIKLQTSRINGSGLTDISSGVLLCLIDEKGSSILQRLPATSVGTDKWSEDNVIYDNFHFQRGGVDEFAFEGPELGKILAIWISLESGQWRLGGISLTVINHRQRLSGENNQENKQQIRLQYNFEVDDILLGEKSETSMVEFRPYSVTTISNDDMINENPLTGSSSLGSYLISNEESMKEYSNLKFSLLFYDVMLILSGSLILSILTEENGSYAFLTGGIFGFLYLLLLQRSVDGLPAPELVPSEENGIFGQILGKLKVPILSLVLAFVFVIVTVKYASGEDAIKLTSKDLVFGMIGFVLCKVSVVLAAFKPISIGLSDSSERL